MSCLYSLLERLQPGLLCGGEVVSPVGNVETGEGAGEHDPGYHIYSLGPGVEVEPELGPQDRPNLPSLGPPHEGRDQRGEQDRLRGIIRSLLCLGLTAPRSEILILSIYRRTIYNFHSIVSNQYQSILYPLGENHKLWRTYFFIIDLGFSQFESFFFSPSFSSSFTDFSSLASCFTTVLLQKRKVNIL